MKTKFNRMIMSSVSVLSEKNWITSVGVGSHNSFFKSIYISSIVSAHKNVDSHH